MDLNALKEELLKMEQNKLNNPNLSKEELEQIKTRIKAIQEGKPENEKVNRFVVHADDVHVADYRKPYKPKKLELHSIEYNIFGKVKKLTFRRGN